MKTSNLATALEEQPDVEMGKVILFPSERPSEPARDSEELGDLFDDASNDKTVVEEPWHEQAILPQPILALAHPPPASPPPAATATVARVAPVVGPLAPMAPLPLAAAPAFFVPRTVVLPSPAAPATTSYAATPTLANARVQIVPARNAWALAFVCVALTLALMIPAVALVAYFAVRTGDSPVVPPATTATSSPTPPPAAR